MSEERKEERISKSKSFSKHAIYENTPNLNNNEIYNKDNRPYLIKDSRSPISRRRDSFNNNQNNNYMETNNNNMHYSSWNRDKMNKFDYRERSRDQERDREQYREREPYRGSNNYYRPDYRREREFERRDKFYPNYRERGYHSRERAYRGHGREDFRYRRSPPRYNRGSRSPKYIKKDSRENSAENLGKYL